MSKATENGSADSHTYTYDAQGQLIREYDPDKELYLGYQYDAGGNLTEVRSYPAGAEGGPEGTGTVLKTFAYCDNNPVMRVDTGGQIWITLGIMAAGGGIGMVIGAASSAITQYMFNGEINWKSVGVAAVGGFVSGAVAASPLGLTGQIGVGAAVGAVSYVADCKVNGSALKVDELAVSAEAGAVSGWIGGSGANQYKALSNTIKTASKTTARFTRLISTKGSASLAAKRIIYHCIYHLFILYCFLFF
ncbi:MAG: RHS repeat domain-containing protein [Coprococcus sp.]